jgi:hypothetical protein
MAKKYIVDLNKDEKAELVTLTQKGRPGARKIKRANILLLANGLRKRPGDMASPLDLMTRNLAQPSRLKRAIARSAGRGVRRAVCIEIYQTNGTSR